MSRIPEAPCGFSLPPHPDNTDADNCARFTTKESRYQISYDRDSTTVTDFIVVPFHEDGETTRIYTQTKSVVDGVCGETFETSDVETYNSLATHPDGVRKWPEVTSNRTSISSSTAPCSGGGSTTTTYESDPPEPEDTETSSEVALCLAEEATPDDSWEKEDFVYTKVTDIGVSSPDTGYHVATDTVTYSGLLTGSSSFPDYPAWPGESADPLAPGQGHLPTAIKSEGCGSDTKFKWRIKHLPTGTCYLKVWLSSIFTPLGGPPGTPVVTSYTWSGSGDPCLSAPLEAADAASQFIAASATEVGVPSSAGTTAVTLLKYSCVDGYEPDISDPENPQPNGYPDPLWEPEAP